MTKTAYIAPDVILGLIINPKEAYKKMFENEDVIPITSAFAYWEAIVCLTEKELVMNADRIKAIMKALPISDTIEITKTFGVPREDRIEHLRKIALKE